MSTLQLDLLVIGALLLVGVLVQGIWNSRKKAPKRLADQEAVMMRAQERQEPCLQRTTTTCATSTLEKSLDPLIDVVATIALENIVFADAVLPALPSTRRVGSKPFAIEGLNAETGLWENPAPGQRYRAFQAGVQLANRTGALNEIEYSEFVIKTQLFADADVVAGEPQFPEMMEEVARARELDQFASAHDAKISFTLRARGVAWSPGYVQQSAARQGFVSVGIAGRMVLPTTASVGMPSVPMVSLNFDPQAALAEEPEQAALRSLTLSLDVPQVPRSERPFARMCEVAFALAGDMEGVIADSTGQIIHTESMRAIGADLEHLYDTLERHDLAAGSALARRLFS